MCKAAHRVSFTLSSFLYRVVIIFIIIKIFFYVCWYRSRQRQLAAYLSNPRNAQIVIVGGRAYLHQMCERQSVSAEPHAHTQPTFKTYHLPVNYWSGFAPTGYVFIMAEAKYKVLVIKILSLCWLRDLSMVHWAKRVPFWRKNIAPLWFVFKDIFLGFRRGVLALPWHTYCT